MSAASKVYDENVIELWRMRAKGLLRSLPTTSPDRKQCLMFLGMSKRGKWPPKWCVDLIKSIYLERDLPSDWSPLDEDDDFANI